MRIPKNSEDDIALDVRYEALKETEEYHPIQEKMVLNELIGGNKTASEIVRRTGIILTSVRRSLTNLKKDGLILAIGRKPNPSNTASETVFSINKNYKPSVLVNGIKLRQTNIF